MAQFVGELETLDQAVPKLLVVRFPAMLFEALAQPRDRAGER